MADQIVALEGGFWNIRGSFKIGGLLDIRTHASLVKLKSGEFVLLDSYTLNDDLLAQVYGLTDGGKAVRAVINLHPFHTVHVRGTHAQFPQARLYGTERHVEQAEDLPWCEERTNSEEFARLFADDLEFTVPDGLDFISALDKVHSSSVLATHRASRSLHVDDTLTYMKLPLLSGVRFHPRLALALKQEPGAAQAFRTWAQSFADQCEGLQHLCAAHTALLSPRAGEDSIADQVRAALRRCDQVLETHQAKFG